MIIIIKTIKIKIKIQTLILLKLKYINIERIIL